MQLGDVFATQTLNVVDVSDQTTATTAANGNSFSGAVVTGSVAVQSSQTLSGNVSATALTNVSGSSGAVTVLSTSATGNDGEADSLGGGALTGTFNQTAGAISVFADGIYHGATAQTGAISSSTQAVANSQGIGVTDASADVSIAQSSSALTQADGGADLQYTSGAAVISGIAISNNVTAVGTGQASQTLNITQSMDGTRTQASQFVAMGNAQDLTGVTSATANNVSVSNENLALNVTVDQTNSSYLRSQADVSSYEFGSGSVQANGVGNSVMAGNFGADITLNNTQSNTGGGIDVLANFTGNSGYDAYSTATAIGNAVTGYSCSHCGGTMTIGNNQFNAAGVGAASTMTVTGSNRSVTSSAAASGNSASFYVSAPTP
ncbi:holdfast anchor protein HfaD [soil metagenome]